MHLFLGALLPHRRESGEIFGHVRSSSLLLVGHFSMYARDRVSDAGMYFLFNSANRAFLFFMAAIVSIDAFLCFYRHTRFRLIEVEEEKEPEYVEMAEKK